MHDPATLRKRFYPFLGGINPLDQNAAETANPETTFITNRQPFNNDRPQPAREANMRLEHRQRSWGALRVQHWVRLILAVAWLLAGATPVTAQSDGATGQERLADHCDVYLKKEQPRWRTIDGYTELDPMREVSGQPAFDAHGAVDAKTAGENAPIATAQAAEAAVTAPAVAARVPLSDALGTLEPAAFWQHFYDLTQLPRPSHHEEQATAFVAAFGESLGLETTVDNAGNVLIRKPASAGLEDRPGVILQAHLDMVPQKTAGSLHDFLTDPIATYIEDGWVHADRTTLGADDGSGVAMIMALLADETLVHPPLEALFTTNEEDGFGGINGLAADVLTGHSYINIDNEVEGQFLVSSAGGLYATVSAVYTEELTPAGMAGVQVTVDGLRGGHSGIDIDKGRGSAHQLIARLLWNAPAELDVRLASLEGGNQSNAIPRTTTVIAAVPKAQVAALTTYVAGFAATVRHELAVPEPSLTITVAPADLPGQVMAAPAQHSLIGAVYGAPQGVIRMSDSVPGLVETSGNIGVLNMAEGKMDATVYVRSAIDSARDDAAARFASVFELAGATVTVQDAYGSWPPDPDSVLLATMTQVYEDLFGAEPDIAAIHAGLETSVAGVKYPGLDMISLGPTILDVHSPDERMEVASVSKVYDLLVATLAQLQEQK